MTAVSQETTNAGNEPPPSATEAHATNSPGAAEPNNASVNPFDDEGAHTAEATTTTPSVPTDAHAALETTQAHNELNLNQENTPDVPPRIPPEVEGLKAMFPDFDVTIL